MHLLLLLLSRFSRVRLCATPQTAAHQAPPSMGFSRQESWSGVPLPSPVMHLSYPQTTLPRSGEKLYSMKPVPGAKKVGDRYIEDRSMH